MNEHDKIRETAFYERQKLEERAFELRKRAERENREYTGSAAMPDWVALLIACLGLIAIGLIWL